MEFGGIGSLSVDEKTVVAEKSRILVVDDNPVNRLLLSETLDYHGFEVVSVANGREALSRILSIHPRLILLDVMMPGMDGFEVMSFLNADSVFCEVPVIFLTALTDRADRLRGLQLGAVDYITKPFDEAEVVAKVKNQVRIQVLTESLKKAHTALVDKQIILDEDLKAAGDIQLSMIPKESPERRYLKFDWTMKPCFSVGGDIFGIEALDSNRTAVHVIDVCGHGASAAMVTMSVAQTLMRFQLGELSPSEIFVQLDELYPIQRFGRFFTMAYALFDESREELTYSTAGHPWPLLVGRDGDCSWLNKGGTVIGLGGPVVYEEETISVNDGDRLCFYSDGLIEMINVDGEPFGRPRLKDLLVSLSERPLAGLASIVIDSIREWSGLESAEDDLTCLIVAYERTP